MRTNLKILRRPEKLLSIFIGCVVTAAALFRVFNMDAGRAEMARLILPEFVLYPIIIVEFAIGIMLLSGWKVRWALLSGMVFMGAAVIYAFVLRGYTLLTQSVELFAFDANPTDVFLHLTYIIIFAYLFLHLRYRTQG
jgi:uncharacterized membrane protein YphA (DoxX/SURF4 family)